MRKLDKSIKIADIEKVYFYDHSKNSYTVELLRKGQTLGEERILMVRLLDVDSKAEWGAPFVEGDSACISPEMLKEIFEELKEWRDKTGDHLGLFTQ